MVSNSKNDSRDIDFRPRPRRKRRVFRLRNLLILLIVIGVVAGFTQLTLKYQEAQRDIERLSNPEEAAKQETQNLKNKISELVEVPQGEEPTIATVQDVTKLQGQSFFKNAQNGDKVLIYSQAQKAILFRPSTSKIIEVAPVNLGNQGSQQSPSGTTTDQPQ